MDKKTRSLGAVILLVFLGLGTLVSCDRKARRTDDPLKEKAREKYAEGRRLFLTCDPNNFPQAIQLLDDALAYWTDYPEALATWSEAMSMWYGAMLPEEVFQSAYMRAQRAIRLAPELDMGYRAMADLFRHRRDPATGKFNAEYALTTIESALKINPTSAENLYVKGSILLLTDPEQALQVLNQARMANPDLGKIYFNLAAAHQMIVEKIMLRYAKDVKKLMEQKDTITAHYGEAEEMLRTYQRIVPGDLAGYCSLGVVYLHQEKIAEAEDQFQKTVSLNPHPDPAQFRWQYIAYMQLAQIAEHRHQDLGGAKSFLMSALRIMPKELETLRQLIRVCKAMKEPVCAAEYQKQFDAVVEEAKAAQKRAEEEKKTRGAPARGSPALSAGTTLKEKKEAENTSSSRGGGNTLPPVEGAGFSKPSGP